LNCFIVLLRLSKTQIKNAPTSVAMYLGRSFSASTRGIDRRLIGGRDLWQLRTCSLCFYTRLLPSTCVIIVSEGVFFQQPFRHNSRAFSSHLHAARQQTSCCFGGGNFICIRAPRKVRRGKKIVNESNKKLFVGLTCFRCARSRTKGRLLNGKAAAGPAAHAS
jgi:hypothetical protein